MGKTGIKERRRGSVHRPNSPWQQHAAQSLFTLPPFIMDDLCDAQSCDDLHLTINYGPTLPPPPLPVTSSQSCQKTYLLIQGTHNNHINRFMIKDLFPC